MSEQEQREERASSEFEESMEHLGRTVGGVMSRLLGEKVTGVELDRSKPTVSPEADEVIEDLGRVAGRWLRAAGEGLKQHPTSPGSALEEMLDKRHEDVEADEGVTPLTVGLKSLAGGIYKSAEGVLDIVAPRKPKGGSAEGDEGDEGEGGDEGERQGVHIDLDELVK